MRPRYCPSIETIIVTFADKDQHQLFLEPEGETTQEYYLNGYSSSLPLMVQVNAMQKIPALADAQIYRPGYAIEYDYFDPTQLRHTLETKLVSGLFFAGQVNGTTGYEVPNTASSFVRMMPTCALRRVALKSDWLRANAMI